MLATSPPRRPAVRPGRAVLLPILAGVSLWGALGVFVMRGGAPRELAEFLILSGALVGVLVGACALLVRLGRPPSG